MIAPEFDLRRLRQDDQRLTSLCLNFSCASQLGDSNRMADLQSSLQKNTSLSSLMIFSDNSFASPFELNTYEGVLQSLGRLPALKHIHMSSSPEAKGVLPVGALIHLLNESVQLQSLLITDLELAGTQDDFDQLAQVMQRLWYLQRFSMEDLRLKLHPTTTNTTTYTSSSSSHFDSSLSKIASDTCAGSSLDSLLLSVSMLPSLTTVTLTAKKDTKLASRHALSVPAFSALFLSSSIKVLTLQNWKWSSEHLLSMSQTLQTNTSLQVLRFGSLSNVSTEAANALAAAIRSNSILAQLELELGEMLSEDVALTLTRALHSNTVTGLQSLILTGTRLGRISKATTIAFQDMLKSNFTLNRCVLFRKNFLQSTIRHYTRLNAMGRRTLLKVDSAPTWMEVLSHPVVQEDLDSIFYFLSSNPTLCVQAAATGSNNAKGKKRGDGPDQNQSSSSKRQKVQ